MYENIFTATLNVYHVWN